MEFNLQQPFVVVEAVIEKDGKFLLVKETKEIAKDQWNLPAGRIESGENLIEGLKREVKEETGYGFEPKHLIGIYSFYTNQLYKKLGFNVHIIQMAFKGDISQEKDKHIFDDISENKWFTFQEIQAMNKNEIRDLHIRQVIQDYLDKKEYPLDIIHHIIRED